MLMINFSSCVLSDNYIREDMPFSEPLVQSEETTASTLELNNANLKTEKHVGIKFDIDPSWQSEKRDDGLMLFYPDTTDVTGFIQCSFVSIPIGSITEQNYTTTLDNGITGMKQKLINPDEISRDYFKIDDCYAVRVILYFDRTREQIAEYKRDDSRGVVDSVLVLREDGVSILLAIFSTSEYEKDYNYVIETTLSSVGVDPSYQPNKDITPPETNIDNKIEELDLDVINNTNSDDFDKQFVGKTYRIRGVIGEAVSQNEYFDDALILIHPNVMAKGMANTLDLEINIWMSPDAFNIVGGETSPGNEVEIIATMDSISRNATSNDKAIRGYPIQLEFTASEATLLSSGAAPVEEVLKKEPEGLSIWDGDHATLKKLIKQSMNDEGSYKHVDTTWIYVDNSTTQQDVNILISEIGWLYEVSIGDFIIITEFSGKNLFNATVKNTAYGIEYKNGDVRLLGIV
jgi:hypothetical protein